MGESSGLRRRRSGTGCVDMGGVLLLVASLARAAAVGGAQEYCNSETFNVSCPTHHIIVMTSANFGRMKVGRCVATDFGFLGCVSDVISLMDQECSGRQTCSVRVADQMFEDVNTCNNEFKSYLEASYACMPVSVPANKNCRISRHVLLTNNTGFITNMVTEETGCGNSLSPWQIEAKPGQRINFTLYDFNWANPPLSRNSCVRYGVIREALHSGVTLCSDDTRISHPYESSGPSVEIEVSPQDPSKRKAHFLLEYKIIGCANLEITNDKWLRRIATGLTVGCANNNDTTWSMKCVENQWIGTVGNCSLHNQDNKKKSSGLNNILTLPIEWAVTIIVGVAVLLSSFIFLIGFAILKRRQATSRHRKPGQIRMHDTTMSRTLKGDFTTTQNLDLSEKYYAGSLDALSSANENEYASVWENSGQSQIQVCMQGHPFNRGIAQVAMPTTCATLDIRGKPLFHVDSDPAFNSDSGVSSIRHVTGVGGGVIRSCHHSMDSSEVESGNSTPLHTMPPKMPARN